MKGERPVLDLMRKHAQSLIIKFVLGGVIIAFAFWFGWGGSGQGTANYAAKVNETIISYDEFQRAYDLERERIKRSSRGAVPPEARDDQTLKKTVIQNMVNQVLLLQEAERLGLFVTEQDLVRDIQSNPLFQRDGGFDEGLYRNFLSVVKFTPARYESARKRELLENQLVRLLTDAVRNDAEEMKKLWHFYQDKLVLSVLLIKSEEAKDRPAADAKTLEAFFTKYQAKYEVPPSVDFRYTVFSWHDLAKGISVSDDEARQYFSTHPREFVVPERIRASHILLKLPENASPEQQEVVRKKAEELLARITGGEDFAQVAQTESQDEATAAKGGDLGFFSRGTMSPEFEKAAARLEVGKVSQPVLTKTGYQLIRVEEKKPEVPLEFDAVKDKIVKKLVEEAARKKMVSVADNFYEEVYRTEKLQEITDKLGFKVEQADGVAKNSTIPELGDEPKILEEAFKLKTGEISRLITSGDRYIVLQLVKRNKEYVPPFEEVRDRVEKDYFIDQDLINARKKARAAIEQLEAQPQDADSIAQKMELTWVGIEPVSRTAEFVPHLGSTPEVKEMLTTISMTNPAFRTPVPIPEGAAVVRLAQMEQATDEQYRKDAIFFEQWVLQVRRTEVLKGWIRLLESRAKIDVGQKL